MKFKTNNDLKMGIHSSGQFREIYSSLGYPVNVVWLMIFSTKDTTFSVYTCWAMLFDIPYIIFTNEVVLDLLLVQRLFQLLRHAILATKIIKRLV